MESRPRRASILAVLAALLLAAIGGESARAAAHQQGGSLGLVPATKVMIFHPKGTQGKAVAGNCGMGESLALDRTDAWRCIVGNEIYDPCFSTSPHARSVICDTSPEKPVGIRVLLPAPLPTHAPAHGGHAWILQLGDGSTCGYNTGATFGIQGQRANYGCSDKDWIVGDPSNGRVWFAVKVQLSTRPSPNGPTASRIFAVSIATVWM